MSRKLNVEDKIAPNLYSTHDILKAMTEFYEEALPQTGHSVSHKWFNIRLFLLFLACSAGLYGQFGAKFPIDYWLIAACVSGYFCFSGMVTLVDYFVIQGSSFVVKDKTGDVFVKLAMNKGESHVTMSLRRGVESQDFKVNIDKLFDVEGNLLQTLTLNVFNQNITAFTRKKNN